MGPRPRLRGVDSAVTVQELVRVFGTHRALDGMTWSAAAGQVTAVLGPNGAGKTTSIECAEGLQRPDGGTVRVLGDGPLARLRRPPRPGRA